MAMPNVARRYTRDEVLAFPDDGNKYELVRGELLVSPPPTMRHQMMVQRLYLSLVRYLEPLELLDTAFCLPGDISWDEESLVQPDLFVTIPEELTGGWSSVRTLRLAVEVLSLSSMRADRVLKRRLYQEHRVGVYWVVDVEGRLVEVWRAEDDRPEIVTEVLQWQFHPDAPEIAIDLPALFLNLPEPPTILR